METTVKDWLERERRFYDGELEREQEELTRVKEQLEAEIKERDNKIEELEKQVSRTSDDSGRSRSYRRRGTVEEEDAASPIDARRYFTPSGLCLDRRYAYREFGAV